MRLLDKPISAATNSPVGLVNSFRMCPLVSAFKLSPEMSSDYSFWTEPPVSLRNCFQIPSLSRTLKASMRVSRQEISVAETTVDRKRSPSWMMMTEWRVVWVMRRQLVHNGRTIICQIRVRSHGPLIHTSGSSAYDIFCSFFLYELLALLMEETNRYYDQTVAALGGLDNLPS